MSDYHDTFNTDENNYNYTFNTEEFRICRNCRHWINPGLAVYGDCLEAKRTDDDAMFSARYEPRHYAVAELWTKAEHGCDAWTAK